MTTLRAVAQWIGLLLLITIVLAATVLMLSPVYVLYEQSHSYRCAT